MLNQNDPTDRRSFIRYVGRLALVGLGVGVLAQPALAEDDPDATCTCCADCQACNCGSCGFGKVKFRCVRAGCPLCTGCKASGPCYTVANCC